MKRIKSFISLLLAFTMLMSIASVSFAEDTASINIETTAGYYNIEEAMSFYASIPDGYTNISVYGDGNEVENAVTTLADNRYKITIPANTFTKYPYAQITVTADDGNGNTLTAERMINTYDPTSTKNMIDTDISEWTVDMGDNLVAASSSEMNKIIKALGFYGGNYTDTDATLVRKINLGDSNNIALALAGPRTNTGTVNIDYRVGNNSTTYCYPTILNASFNLYPAASETFIFKTTEAEFTIDLTDGVWNHVSIQYDYDKDIVVVSVDDGAAIRQGTYDDFTLTQLNLIRFRFTPGKDASSFIAIDDIKVDCHETIAKRFELTSPTEGETVTGEFTAKAKAIDAEKVYLYVDGVKTDEKTGIAGKQTYSFTLSPADIGYGDKEIRVVAVYADGTMDSGSAVVSVDEVVESAVHATKATDALETFNDLTVWSDSTLDTDDKRADFKKESSWYIVKSDTQMNVSRVKGRSGEAGDYALSAKLPVTTKSGTGAYRLYFLEGTPSLDGAYNMEFDMKVNTDQDIIRLLGPKLWVEASKSYTNGFIVNGKLAGDVYDVTPGEWIHYKLKLEDGKWYVTVHKYNDAGEAVNEQVVVSGRTAVEGTTSTGVYMVVYQSEAREEGNEAGLTIDNARVWLEKSTGGVAVQSLTYDEAQTVSNHTVPYTAKTLTVNLDSAVASDALTAELYVNNEEIEADVSIDSAAVTITLPELEAGSKLKVILKDKAESWADVSTFAYVSDENGLYTGCLEYFEEDGQFIAHTIAASNTRLKGIVASYADNSMTDVNVTDIFAPAGDSCTMLQAGNSVKTKVMIWDSIDTIKPLMKAYTLGE